MLKNTHIILAIHNCDLTAMLGPSPWVYEDSIAIPQCSWETLMVLLKSIDLNAHQLLEDYLYHQSSWLVTLNGALSSVVKALVSIDVYQPNHTKFIKTRITSKQDHNFALSEYARMLQHLVTLMQLAIEKQAILDTWID